MVHFPHHHQLTATPPRGVNSVDEQLLRDLGVASPVEQQQVLVWGSPIQQLPPVVIYQEVTAECYNFVTAQLAAGVECEVVYESRRRRGNAFLPADVSNPPSVGIIQLDESSEEEELLEEEAYSCVVLDYAPFPGAPDSPSLYYDDLILDFK